MDLNDTVPSRPTSGTVISQLMLGFMTTQIVNTALQLDLPDRLGDEARTADELANETATHPASLNRLLRALAGLGITDEVTPGRFALSSTGRRLRRDVSNSLHAMARVFTDDSMTRGWSDLTACVRTGEPSFDRIFGTDYYTRLAADPALSHDFNEAHGEAARRAALALARGYDFAGVETIVDVGGGDGTLLAAVLTAAPAATGIVYDTASGLESTSRTLEAADVAERCEIRAGDFLTKVPEGADLYLVKSTLHNWDDEHASMILDSCRRAMSLQATLVLVESLLPPRVDPASPPFGYFSDLNMLVNLGGRERTEADFAELLSACGFSLTSVRALPDATNLGLSVIEAAPA